MATEFKDKNGDWIVVSVNGESIEVANQTKGGRRYYTVGKPGILEHFEMMEIESVEQVINAYKTGKVYFD